MIDYSTTSRGDILRIVGEGAPGYAELGDLVRVVEVHKDSVLVEDRDGKRVEFVFNCGAARLKATEWKDDFPPTPAPAASVKFGGFFGGNKVSVKCRDCGAEYETLGCDLALPDQQWEFLCPEDDILCANCICKRAEKCGGTVLLAWIADFDYARAAEQAAAPDAAIAAQIVEEQRINEVEMWGRQGCPKGPFA